MKILYSNLNIVDISCYSKDNTKDQCSCISIVVASKIKYLV